jgi:hypothetical protein
MHKDHDRTGVVTVHRGVSERRQNARRTTSAAAGQSDRRLVSRDQALHDQVRNLRIALSDLKIEVRDLAAEGRRSPSK